MYARCALVCSDALWCVRESVHVRCTCAPALAGLATAAGPLRWPARARARSTSARGPALNLLYNVVIALFAACVFQAKLATAERERKDLEASLGRTTAAIEASVTALKQKMMFKGGKGDAVKVAEARTCSKEGDCVPAVAASDTGSYYYTNSCTTPCCCCCCV